MTTMTRGLAAPRRAVAAATTRGDVANHATAAMVGRTAAVGEPGKRRAMAREHAWIEAAASAALRGGRA